MQFSGKMVHIGEPKEGSSANGDWATREFVVEEVGADYNQRAKFSMFKKGDYLEYATSKFDFAVGDFVNVEFSLSCNEYQGKFYNDLRVFKISKNSGVEEVSSSMPSLPSSDEENPLPF